jgi:uncharacterized membrane protein YphA (DoxX/SURF4 family)
VLLLALRETSAGSVTMRTMERGLVSAWWVLRVGLGVGILLAGLDKFFNFLTTWSMYMSPLADKLLPVGEETFLHAVGVLEMSTGLAILTRWTRVGAYVLAGWLLCIVVNLAATASFWDLVVRDLEVCFAAYALARLTEWRASTARD